MKILLDENISDRLFLNITGHQIASVKSMGWRGKKNGELLGLMTINGFEILITRDKNLSRQQNISKFKITIILLRNKNSREELIIPLVDKVRKLLKSKLKQGVIEVS